MNNIHINNNNNNQFIQVSMDLAEHSGFTNWGDYKSSWLTTNQINRPFAANDHLVQNPPCWRASSLLFLHWDIKTKASQASLVQGAISRKTR